MTKLRGRRTAGRSSCLRASSARRGCSRSRIRHARDLKDTRSMAMRAKAASAVVAATLLFGANTAFAANKDQQLLMAELRIMQQQQQQLQQMIAGLAESVKSV